MKHIKFIWGGLLVLSALNQSEAQQLPVLGQFQYNNYLYNPARTGDAEVGSININLKRQWTSMPNAPMTGILSFETPVLGSNIGIGAMIYTDQSHIIRRVGGMGSFAYHFPFSKKINHKLSLGLNVGFIHQNFDFSSAQIENMNDVQLSSTLINSTNVDLSAGINYSLYGLNLGFSMFQGLNNQMIFENTGDKEISFINSRHFLGIASYDIVFGKEKTFTLRPTALVRYTPGLPIQAEASFVMNWNRLLWGSVGYRSSNWQNYSSALTASLGIELKKKFFIAYNFEITPDMQLINSLGFQHEVMIAYRFGKDERIQKQIDKMKISIDSVKDENSKTSEKLVRTEQKIKQLNTLQEKLNAENKTLSENVSKLESTNKNLEQAIAANEKEIEKLKEAVKKQPFNYNKLHEVYFAANVTSITENDKVKLKALYEELNKRDFSKIYLYGYASKDGSAEKNYALSLGRCNSVKDFLVSLGMSETKIIVLAKGSESPIAGFKNGNPVDRRVDIIVLD
jgi:type IX secretion system PorP/SprF family membrane protein